MASSVTISSRLLRALSVAGVCFAFGTTASILMGVPWHVAGILASTTVAVFVWRSKAKT
jgi:hypothetical protein